MYLFSDMLCMMMCCLVVDSMDDAGSSSDRRVSPFSHEQRRIHGSSLQTCKHTTHRHFHRLYIANNLHSLANPSWLALLYHTFCMHIYHINHIRISFTVWKELEKENKDFFEAYEKSVEGKASYDHKTTRQRIQKMVSDSSKRHP